MFTQCKNIKIVNKLIHNVVTYSAPRLHWPWMDSIRRDGQPLHPSPFSPHHRWIDVNIFPLLNIFVRCGWAAPLRTCTRGQQPGRGRGACSGTTSTETSRQTSWAASRRWVADTRAVNEPSRSFITATFQVSFTADSIHLPILELAKQGHALIR